MLSKVEVKDLLDAWPQDDFAPPATVGRQVAEIVATVYDVLWERTAFCRTRLNEAVHVLVYDFEARRELGATPLVFRGFLGLLCHPCNKALQRAKWQRPRMSADDFAELDILC